RFREAGIRSLELAARSLVAELHLRHGATGRARAELEEIALAAPETECDFRRISRIKQAALAVDNGGWEMARSLLPPVAPPAGCTTDFDVEGLRAAVELARRGGDSRDADVARRWIEHTGVPAYGGFALTGLLRISYGADTGAVRSLEGWIREETRRMDPDHRARAWAMTTLISGAGARADWE